MKSKSQELFEEAVEQAVKANGTPRERVDSIDTREFSKCEVEVLVDVVEGRTAKADY